MLEGAPQPPEAAAPGPPIEEPPALESEANVSGGAANPEPDLSRVPPRPSPMLVLSELLTAQGMIVALLLTPFSQESADERGDFAEQK